MKNRRKIAHFTRSLHSISAEHPTGVQLLNSLLEVSKNSVPLKFSSNQHEQYQRVPKSLPEEDIEDQMAG